MQLVALCFRDVQRGRIGCQYNGGMEKIITIAFMLVALCGAWTGAASADARSGRETAAAPAPAQTDAASPKQTAVRGKDKPRKFHSVSSATRKVKRKPKKAVSK